MENWREVKPISADGTARKGGRVCRHLPFKSFAFLVKDFFMLFLQY